MSEEIFFINLFAKIQKGTTFALPNGEAGCGNIKLFLKGAHSSAGSEHLPYKQGVQGSNPCGPTKVTQKWVTFFSPCLVTSTYYFLFQKTNSSWAMLVATFWKD
jgi:hypothetical protein